MIKLHKPRIVILPVMTWKQAGGLEAVTADVALTFANMGCRVVVFSVFGRDITENIEGVEVVNLYPRSHWLRSLWRRVFWRPVLAWRVWQQLIGGGLLVIGHAHLLPLLDFLPKCPNVKRWAWAYGLEVWGREASRWASRLNKLDRIVSISSFTANQVVRAGVTSRIEIIPPFVDVTKFTPTITPERIRRNEILVCGRIVSGRFKGHDLLIETLPLAEHLVGQDLRLRIVGVGDDFDRILNKVRQLNLEEKVFLMGRLSLPELVEAYQHCGVFCMPSRLEKRQNGYWSGEGFGLVYIEAAACGRPVIASTDGGAPETIVPGETGLLADPQSLASVAYAIADILRDPRKADIMGQKGRQMIEHRFKRDVFSQHLEELILKDFS